MSETRLNRLNYYFDKLSAAKKAVTIAQTHINAITKDMLLEYLNQ